MDSEIKQMRGYFETLSEMGHDPLLLRKWDYEFFDTDTEKLKKFCESLISAGYTFEGVKRDGSVSFEPGWVVRVSEIIQHTPESLSNRIAELNQLVRTAGIFLLCGYSEKKPPTRPKVSKAWKEHWDMTMAKEQAKLNAAAVLISPEADAFFARESRHEGGLTGWIPFLKLKVRGSHVRLADMRSGPTPDGLTIDLPSDNYRLEFIGYVAGLDRRCARLRCVRFGAWPSTGKQIGPVSTDLATLGIYDPKCFQSLLCEGNEAFFEWGETAMDPAKHSHGVLIYDLLKDSILPYVSSGFGDGTFPVFELTENANRVGFEVEFINESDKAPAIAN